MTTLTHKRGDTFRWSFTLGSIGGVDEWVGADFTGGVFFTVRSALPATALVADDDSAVLVKTSVADGGITFVADVGTVTIAASVANTWQPARYLWDIQGVVDGSPDAVHTLDSGEFVVTADVTRRTS